MKVHVILLALLATLKVQSKVAALVHPVPGQCGVTVLAQLLVAQAQFWVPVHARVVMILLARLVKHKRVVNHATQETPVPGLPGLILTVLQPAAPAPLPAVALVKVATMPPALLETLKWRMNLVMPVHPALGRPGHMTLVPLPAALAQFWAVVRVRVAITPTAVLGTLNL